MAQYVDLLDDTRKRLSIASRKFDGGDLLGLLRKIDSSFEPLQGNPFRAANNREFMVDLVIPPLPMHSTSTISFSEDDLTAVEAPGLEWLVSSPRFEAVCIDENGWPARMVVPDPRAFSRHKAWLSMRADRDPIKKPRDKDQSQLVESLVRDYFPHLSFDSHAINALPKAVKLRPS